jgi:gamma-butyrobetaine dioxygenase
VSAGAVLGPGLGAELAGDVVVVRFADGRGAELHRLALRDGCPCESCRHPESGQRRFETLAVVPPARIASLAVDEDRLDVDWEDGHRSSYDRDWLAAAADAARGGEPRRPTTLWGSELDPVGVTASYEAVTGSSEALHEWLGEIAELGFGVLAGCPLADGTVAEVAELFGHVRTTNYGRVFDVSVRVEAANLADTALPLSLHTDNAYRVPAPTLQLLHCLVSDAEGGATVLADGFRAVALLADGAPEQLALLARTPIRFSYRDASADLEADVPVVELDASGLPAALHVNNRSKGVPAGRPALVAAWYAAYFELLRLLDDPDAQVRFRLDPGDLVVFDNLRVLHGRTGFSGAGDRRLQGCYADRDGLLSTLAVLERGKS